MQRFLIGLAPLLLMAGCGFDTITGPSAAAGSPTASNGGSGPVSSGGANSSAGAGGQLAGAGGALVTPTAGTPNAGGTLPGSNGGAGGTAPTPGGGSGGTPSSGGGDTPSGGASGGAGGSGAAPPANFTLLWRDDFDNFDTARWSKATHTFDENLARFVPDNAVVEGGMLKLRVTNVPQGNKQYSAAEVFTKEQFTFGRFEGRIKFCPGSGMVSSLFTYKDEVDTSWQEIDIEHLGYLPKSMQYNLVSGSLNSRKYQPRVVNLGYSPAEEFHDYAIEWTPDAIKFFVDGQPSHQDVQASIKDAARLRMNTWPANYAVTNFAGPLDTTAVPCESQYDWVQVYAYTP